MAEKMRLANVNKQMARIEEELKKIHPMVREANEIAKTLSRKILFTINIEREINPATNQATGRVIPKIVVKNNEDNYSYIWTVGKFEQRMYKIKEYLDDFLDDGIL